MCAFLAGMVAREIRSLLHNDVRDTGWLMPLFYH